MAALAAWLDPLWATAFSLWHSPVTWGEVLAFGLSLWMVERNIRVSVWAWPLAMAASLLYLGLFARSGLYGESALQALFVLISAWGWQQWHRGDTASHPQAAITRLTAKQRGWVSMLTLATWPVLGWLLQHHTDSSVPYLDALLTCASVAGQWLLARKHLETWPVWLAVNLGSVALFAYKDLALTALLYALFALLSWVGWQAWRRQVASQA